MAGSSEDVLSMVDVLEEDRALEEEANAVLGASDDQNCTYPQACILLLWLVPPRSQRELDNISVLRLYRASNYLKGISYYRNWIHKIEESTNGSIVTNAFLQTLLAALGVSVKGNVEFLSASIWYPVAFMSGWIVAAHNTDLHNI